MASAPAAAASTAKTARSLWDDTTIPLIDPNGEGFELLRAMDLGGLGLCRITDTVDVERLANGQIIIAVAYTPDDITRAHAFMGRLMTIVLAMGLGPQFASRALTLGAVGYVEASRDEADILGLIGDAIARVRMRRLRESAA